VNLSPTLKAQAGRFLRLFLLAFVAAATPALLALHGPVDTKVLDATIAGAAVAAAETAWRQLRPTIAAGSLVDLVATALQQAQQKAAAANADVAKIQALVVPQPAAPTPAPAVVLNPTYNQSTGPDTTASVVVTTSAAAPPTDPPPPAPAS